jgi:signal transduction histidine kinase
VALEAWRHVPTGDAELELGDLGRIRSDHTRLLHVFENLYRNAVEHGTGEGAQSVAASDGGASATITVRVWLDEDQLHIADDGPGMDPEIREQALEAGYSTQSDGTGLGLFIVKEIAEAHDWTVELGESEAGGLLVTFHGVERA